MIKQMILAYVLGLGAMGVATAQEAVREKPAIVEEEKQAMTLSDIPGYSIKTVDWNPMDITSEFASALECKVEDLFSGRRGEFRNWPQSYVDKVNRDGGRITYRIWVDKTGKEHSLEKLLDKKYKGPFIWDLENKKILTLKVSDEAMFPEGDTSIWSWDYVNGVATYDVSLHFPQTDKEKDARIQKRLKEDATVIADIKNKRKLILRNSEFPQRSGTHTKLLNDGNYGVIFAGDKMYIADFRNNAVLYDEKIDRKWRDSYVKISEDRNIVCFTDEKNNFRVFDAASGKITYERKGFVEGVNHDGSFAVFQTTGLNAYYRVDVKNKKIDYMWPRDRTRIGFSLSPNGNFCKCWTQNFGDDYRAVYVHNTKEYFQIQNNNLEEDIFDFIDNEGTLHFRNGSKYIYKDGMYHWEPNSHLKRNSYPGLKITKVGKSVN